MLRVARRSCTTSLNKLANPFEKKGPALLFNTPVSIHCHLRISSLETIKTYTVQWLIVAPISSFNWPLVPPKKDVLHEHPLPYVHRSPFCSLCVLSLHPFFACFPSCEAPNPLPHFPPTCFKPPCWLRSPRHQMSRGVEWVR